MLDQCHNIEPKIPGQIRSVMNVQEATAKALLVDREALAAAQRGGDVLGANAVLMDAYNTDVRPLLAELRDGARPGPGSDGGLRPVRLRRAHRRRARRRPAGRLGRMSWSTGPGRPGRRSLARRAVQPVGRGPAHHELRGRQHVGQGTAIDPVTGEPAELLWVKGSGGDLGR